MNTASAAPNGLRSARALAALFVVAGLFLVGGILGLKPGYAPAIHAAIVLEGVFALFLGVALLTITCCLPRWSALVPPRIWHVAIAGIGLVFLYATADVTDNFVRFTPGDALDVFEEVARLSGVAALVGSIGLWANELVRTHRRFVRREERLQESEQKFRTLFDFYPDATVLINYESKLPEDFNQRAHVQLGYSAPEFARLRIADYEAIETPEETTQRIQKILEHGHDEFRTKHRCKDGSILDVHVSIVLITVEKQKYFLCLFRDITDHLATMQALEESEQRFRDVAEAAGEYIWEIDPAGTYRFLTPRAEELFGRNIDAMLGHSPFDFMPSEDAERVEQLLTGWAERGESWQNLVHQTIRPDGTIAWQRVSGMPIFGEKGQLRGFRGTGLDITTETQARQEQQELANRLRLATEAAELGIWDLRIADGYLEWDEGMHRIYGISREAFTHSSEDWLQALLPEFRDQAPRELQKGISDGQAYESEFKIRRGDGNIRHIRAMAQPIYDQQGNAVRVVGTNEDITETKQAAERLHEQERLYRGLVESQQDLIVRVDSAGRFSYVNDAYCRKFGKQRAELLGSSFTPLVHEDDVQATMQAMENLKHPPHRAYIEQRAQTEQGWRWLSWEDSAVVDDQGSILVIQGVGRDITDLKEAQRKAEIASRSKSEFLANMSHEIRTPMNAVIGLIQLLLQTPLNATQRDYLGKINNSSRMLLGIINDILDYSKIEAGKLELDIHTFHLDELLDQMRTLFGSAAEDKGLELVFRVPPDTPTNLQGDSLRLGQVFTNLLGNALKFTHTGQVELVVQKLEQSEGADSEGHATQQTTVRLRFEIRDTGIGMDQEQIDKLFQAFTQADTSTTRKYGGTGLGLVISQKLVERMGGVLEVVSLPDQGSRFSFDLELPLAEETGDTNTCREFEGHRVLVADDHAVARQVLREILESCTFDITEVEDGAAAIAAVLEADKAGAPFEYIFMDWKMPGELDGLQALNKLHQLHAEGSLSGDAPPTVIVSAYKRDELPETDNSCLQCFLSKPVTASSVFDALAEAGGEAPQRQSQTATTAIPSFFGSAILLAEDNRLNQEVAQQMLEKTNAAVTIANNGAEAVDLAAHGDFDLVLMDLQMPVMDGFEATRHILEHDPELPVIALSAAVMESDQKNARAVGMRTHLAKPIDSGILYVTIARFLPQQGAPAPKQHELGGTTPELPESLEGFDLQQGLKAADGDTGFYLQMLHRFQNQLETTFAVIETTLQNGDAEGPRMVHTLKGLAGTVGAVRVAAVASAIDQNMKNGHTTISSKTGRELGRALEAAREQLQYLPPLPHQAKTVDPEACHAAFAELRKLLQTNALVEEDLLGTVVDCLQDQVDSDKLATLHQHIENFEHDAAAVLLEELAATRGVQFT